MTRYVICDSTGNAIAGPWKDRETAARYLDRYYTGSIFGPCHIETREYIAK